MISSASFTVIIQKTLIMSFIQQSMHFNNIR
jgi:hypothetical protein